MNRTLIFLLLTLNTLALFGQNNRLEQAREKYDRYKSLSYTVTAFYPNPETEAISTFSTFYILNHFKKSDFEFFTKTDQFEEVLRQRRYSAIDHNEKAIYHYEDRKNQDAAIKDSRLVQYGPTFLLKHHWNFENEALSDGVTLGHYSFVEKVQQYEGKTIKAEFHIYISPDFTISKFERKSYVDDKLGQTITYLYSNYKFSKKTISFPASASANYALKYFEKNEVVTLEAGTKAPGFVATDMANNQISEQSFIGKNTLLLFSSIHCGASKIVSDFITDINFRLPDNLTLMHVYASDSKEDLNKYFRNRTTQFPIITNQKALEYQYQVSGYPILYLIDEKGIISQIFEGYEPIIQFLKEKKL